MACSQAYDICFFLNFCFVKEAIATVIGQEILYAYIQAENETI